MRVIKRLVPKPQSAESLTRAAIYYTVDAERPTILLDEGDYKLLALQPELVAVLNSGHEVEGRVGLMVPEGKGYSLRYFSTSRRWRLPASASCAARWAHAASPSPCNGRWRPNVTGSSPSTATKPELWLRRRA